MHMSQTIGGYCFFNEDFTIELDEPRYVDVENVTAGIFNDDGKVLEINSKTGLYPLYVAYTFYRLKIKDRENELSFDDKKRLWDEVVENNVYVICKTKMAKQITSRTLLGYTKGKINAHAFDDLINQMKEKQQQLVDKILKPSFWNKGGKEMKFNAVVGNPPYQGVNHQQIYPYFYLTSIKLGNIVSLIFPTGWQQPKNANNLGKMNIPEVKKDKQIVFIDNKQNVFPGITGAEWTNVILWKKGYDNGLNGSQLIYKNGNCPEEIELPLEVSSIAKPKEIIDIGNIITRNPLFKTMMNEISANKPYGLRTNIIGNYTYYRLPEMMKDKKSNEDLTVYASNGRIVFCSSDYPLPKCSIAINKYKLFIPSAWGNMSENSGLGGAYSDVIIGGPRDICTETFVECGIYDNYELAKKASKYVLSKFVRALIYVNKVSQQSSRSVWASVPTQDFSESWWDKSIAEIDEELFKKYNIPENIREFVRNNIQTKTIANIVNYE